MRILELVMKNFTPIIVKYVIAENSNVLMSTFFTSFSNHTVIRRRINSPEQRFALLGDAALQIVNFVISVFRQGLFKN